MNLLSNAIGDCNNGDNFPDNSLLTFTQVSRFCKAFVIGSSADTKFSKTQLFKMVQFEGSIFNKMLGQFNPFKTLNSVDDSMELYKEELEKYIFYEMKVFKKKVFGSEVTVLIMANKEMMFFLSVFFCFFLSFLLSFFLDLFIYSFIHLIIYLFI